MRRIHALLLAGCGIGLTSTAPLWKLPTHTTVSAAIQNESFELNELTIAQLQDGMTKGRYSSRQLTQLYLQRIERIDRGGPQLRSISETNPDALAIADALDAERKAKGVRGPLHGIPIVVKDNIDTADRMTTTAGSLALEGSIAQRDAFAVERLRAAGAVIIAKTSLSEWANFRSTKSSSGWSGRGGQVKNAYALDRNPCGSSSGTGTAVAANLAAAGVGTETDGSIVCPSAVSGLVGIKPTVGRVSRSGIIPISHTQDTAGPMARTVADAAALLEGMAGRDPDDSATHSAGAAKPLNRLSAALDPGALKGARIGVARKRYFGYSPATDKLIEAAILEMKKLGATVIDPADIPTAAQLDDCEFEVLLYEFKEDLNKYLGGLPATAPHRSLESVIAFNEREKDTRNAVLRSGDHGDGAEERRADVTGLSPGADDLSQSRPDAGHRRRDLSSQAGRHCRADRQPRVADRSRERRSFPRSELDSRGGGRLSQCNRACGRRVRLAGRDLVHRPRLERSTIDRFGFRVRASHETPQATAVSRNDSSETVVHASESNQNLRPTRNPIQYAIAGSESFSGWIM